MDRRDFLKAAGVAGAGVGLAGFHCGRQLHARSTLQETLIEQSQPVLTNKALSELRTLPARGREAIRTWFHGPCLNAANFASRITSEDFRAQLARCTTEEQQDHLFLVTFLSTVTTEDAIRNRIEVIAEEIGGDLDRNWEQCCREIATSWGIQIRSYGEISPAALAASFTPPIRAAMDESIGSARAMGQHPTFVDTVGDIGETAILLLPMTTIPKLAIPVIGRIKCGQGRAELGSRGGCGEKST
jgi:hypothetical protein